MVLALWAVNFAFPLPIFSVSHLLMLFRYFPISLSNFGSVSLEMQRSARTFFSPRPFHHSPSSSRFNLVVCHVLLRPANCTLSFSVMLLRSRPFRPNFPALYYFPSLSSDILHSLTERSLHKQQLGIKPPVGFSSLPLHSPFAVFLFLGALTARAPSETERESQFKCYIFSFHRQVYRMMQSIFDTCWLLFTPEFANILVYSFHNFVDSFAQHRNANRVAIDFLLLTNDDVLQYDEWGCDDRLAVRTTTIAGINTHTHTHTLLK